MTLNETNRSRNARETSGETRAAGPKIPSVSTLLHIFWLKKWLVLLVWLLLAIPSGVLLSIFDIPRSYSATTVLRFPNVVGAQTNVMRDVAITQRESILGIINSWQVLEATIRKLSLRMRITTHDVFQKKVFKSVTYSEDLGQGQYVLQIEKGSRQATLTYKPKEANGEYNLFKGPIPADNRISINGLELVLNEGVFQEHPGLKLEMEFLSIEETVEGFRDATKVRSLGSNNLEVKLKDRDPDFIAEILNSLRAQFLEVYYGTTEVQDVGILVQMEKDLDVAKKKLDVSQADVSNFYEVHPELMRSQTAPEPGDNLTYLESRQELDRISKTLQQIKSVSQAKPIGGSEDELFYWGAEMVQTMMQANEPKAVILRGTLSTLNAKSTTYKSTLGPEHPKVAELALQRDTLYAQIDKVVASLTQKLEKDLGDARVRASHSAPTRVAQVPVKLQLELERLTQINSQSQQIYDHLLESYNRAKLMTGSEFFKVTVVDPARPAIYKKPTLWTRLLIAAAAQLILSILVPALLLLWHVFFLKVWTKEDISNLLEMKVLGAIAFNPNANAKIKDKKTKAPQKNPRHAKKNSEGEAEVEQQPVADLNAQPPALPPDPLLLFYGKAYRVEDLEAFRVIREEAENFFRNTRAGKCCLMVTSTQPSEGKTIITSNLAMTFARKGKRTLLVDADFRLGRVDKVFNLPGTTGLDELLSQTDLSDEQFMETVTLCFQPTMQRNLVVVPRKKFNPNAGEMVSSDRFKAFIRLAREQFDIVLIDTPPVMITPEPLSLAEVTDGVIYICRSGNTSISDSLEAVKILEERGVKVAAVLNGLKSSPFIQNRYTQYSYYYGPGKNEMPSA